MEGNVLSIPTNSTIPLTDVLRARISNGRVSLPVRGSTYARLQHISAVPSIGGNGGYSISRLQAIDSLLSRIEGMREATQPQRSEAITPDVRPDLLEEQQRLVDEATRRIVDDIESGRNRYGLAEGLLLDMTA